jgi:uncharacterized protein (TIGR00299 family) protein
MKVLLYDCFSGISGDMNLGAMLDIGISQVFLEGELNKLNLKGWELIAVKDQRHGISGTKVTIQTHHDHSHRHLSDIERIITGSSLSGDVKKLSLNIFRKVADAEALVHDIPVEKVHFHEVGAIDSIIDIVGAAICFNELKVDRVIISEVELGGGLVKCEHGTLPVPAPATLEIIKGIPVKSGSVDFEATTPTGAAILSVFGTDFGKTVPVRILKTAYGVGHKDHPAVPNLLRVSLGEMSDNENPGHDALQIECNIDDMNPEFYEYISDKLFKAGASDVYYSNIIMKKGRPGIILNVICETGIADSIKDILFSESTTLGVRSFLFRKDTLSREFSKLSTVYGDVTVKHSFLKGKEVSVKPEFEDCKKIAAENGIPVKDVYNNIMSVLTKNPK